MTTTFTRATLAGVLALGLVGAAQAQVAPAIPTPANPTPAFPVTTDGTPLPPRVHDYAAGDVLTGRSAFAPVGGLVGAGLGTANAVVDGTAGALGVR